MRLHTAILSIFIHFSIVLANHTGENNQPQFLHRTTDNASGGNLVSEYVTGAAYDTGIFNFTTATFDVPTVTGDDGQNAFIWTGFYDTTNFLQAGVIILIEGDDTLYQAVSFWDFKVKGLLKSEFPVSPGDVITISINMLSDTSADIIFANGGNKKVQDLTSDTSLSAQNVVWGIERYPNRGDLVGFDTVTFADAEAYGPDVGIYALDQAILTTMVHNESLVAIPYVEGRSMKIVHQ